MQFMNSNLDLLAKNLSENDFKYLSQEFSGECLKLTKQKGMYLYENIAREVVFLILLKDIVKLIINTQNAMIVVKKVNTLLILMQTIYMVGQ